MGIIFFLVLELTFMKDVIFHLKLVDYEPLGNLFFKTDIQCV